MNKDKFCVFILSHGRPDNVKTLKTLKKAGYRGDWFIIIDDEDETGEQYKKNFGKNRVITFCKKYAEKITDKMDLLKERDCVVFARNSCFEIAKKLGYDFFLELDDDYSSFQFRHDLKSGFCNVSVVRNINKVFECFIKFLKNTNTLVVAMAQGGDFIGGGEGIYGKKVFLTRKVMNTFFCNVKKPFKFLGRINEDTNFYVYNGMIGNLCFTTSQIMIVQTTTQQSKGGLTDIYKSLGTFCKSFYTVIINPSAVKISAMGDTHYRIHHKINWRYAVPLILRETAKKL